MDENKEYNNIISLSSKMNTKTLFTNGVRFLSDEKEIAAAKYIEEAAINGLPAAMHNLSALYYEGKGVEKNIFESYYWLRKAAETDLHVSQCILGIWYITGEDIEQDIDTGVEWLYKSAKYGKFPLAQFYLANLILGNKTERFSKKLALEFILEAEKEGLTEAKTTLGVMYSKGDVVEQDIDKAIAYFKLASEEGSLQATYNLVLLISNKNNVYYDYDESIKKIKTIMDSDYNMGLLLLGNFYLKNGKNEKEKKNGEKMLKEFNKNTNQHISFLKKIKQKIFFFKSKKNADNNMK